MWWRGLGLSRLGNGLGWTVFITNSDSMRPGIFAGDAVVVRRTGSRGRRFDVGDVVACRSGGDGATPELRRICRVLHPSNGDVAYLTTCGQVIAPAAIIGGVATTFANLGRVFHGRGSGSRLALTGYAPAPNAQRARRRSLAVSGEAQNRSLAAHEAANDMPATTRVAE